MRSRKLQGKKKLTRQGSWYIAKTTNKFKAEQGLTKVFDNVRFQIPLLYKTGHLAEPLNKVEWNRHFEIGREPELYRVRELIRSHEYNFNYSWCEMFVSVPCLVSVVGALTWTREQDLSKNLLLRVVFKMFRYSFSETMQIFPSS